LIESNISKTGHWYLLQTKFKQENKAAQELRQQNITVFLPLHKIERLVSGKKIIKTEPLFSRYLFAELDIKNTNWTSIRSTRGISKFVEFGNGPAIVESSLISELKKIDSMSPEPYIKIGEKIKLMSGSLKGLSAIYQAADGSSRSIIMLQFMQHNQELSVDNNSFKKG